MSLDLKVLAPEPDVRIPPLGCPSLMTSLFLIPPVTKHTYSLPLNISQMLLSLVRLV